MTLFNPTEPIVRSKQEFLDLQDLEGVWRFHWKIGYITILSGLYTRIDQVFIIWGVITAVIFATAQFLTLDWMVQAGWWSALTLVGIASMAVLTWFWVRVERLCWIMYLWAILMLAGMALTDLSISAGWGEVLIQLCPLWLGLCALGYLGTGLGMRSRTFLIVGIIQLLGIVILPYVGGWQFLSTGIVIGGSLLVLAQTQWDMRPPSDSNFLTPQQNQFNRQQQLQRQLEVQRARASNV